MHTLVGGRPVLGRVPLLLDESSALLSAWLTAGGQDSFAYCGCLPVVGRECAASSSTALLTASIVAISDEEDGRSKLGYCGMVIPYCEC